MKNPYGGGCSAGFKIGLLKEGKVGMPILSKLKAKYPKEPTDTLGTCRKKNID